MHRFLALLLVAGCAFAQDAQNAPVDGKSAHLTAPPQVSTQVTERLMPVSHSDLYCSGYLAKAPVKNDSYVMGGLNSPNATRFHARDYIFINGDYAPGSRVSFIRQTKDPDRLDSFEGQTKALKQTGAIFGELGYAVVVEKRGSAIVAQV